MRKTFVLNLGLQVALNLIVKPLYILGVDRAVQNTVGSKEYGFYAALFNLSLILQMVNDFGIQNFISKNIAEKPENASKHFSNLLVFKVLLSAGYLILTFFIATILGYSSTQIKLLFVLSLVQILSSFFLFFRANIAALGFFQRDSFLSVFDRLGLIILCFFLIFYQYLNQENGIWYFAAAQVFSMTLACVIAYFFIRQKVDFQRVTLNFSFIKETLFSSLPFAIITLLMALYTRLDSVLLERLLPDGNTEAGIYASAYRLLDALNALTLIFGTLLLPMFARQIGNGESEKPLLRLSLTLVSFISISAAFLIFGHRSEIMTLLYHEANDYWASILGILILSYIPLSLMYVLGALSTAKNLLRPMQYVFGSAAFFNIVLNIFLITTHKAQGAAYASLFTQCFVVLGLLYINHFSIEVKSIFKTLLFAVLHAFCIYFLQKTNLDWRFQIFIAGAATFVWSTLLGFWDLKSIWKMLSEKR
jgi:O-antigen/teichoic acid export membrane protein